ncbi:hypothetical protein H6G35_21490 [Aulosira sp. FACHB-113]|uniref:hypothetical protein n=1 Tax=Tolypothrix tenuis TaxID=457083 RepID=UPI00168840E9|nr:hypothetical protein [Aulosira sp. FACHB-113]
MEKAESRFFASLRLCVRQKSSHQSATPKSPHAVDAGVKVMLCISLSPWFCVAKKANR